VTERALPFVVHFCPYGFQQPNNEPCKHPIFSDTHQVLHHPSAVGMVTTNSPASHWFACLARPNTQQPAGHGSFATDSEPEGEDQQEVQPM
jgi:hypothetical protein